jgi:hypothetical protein
MGYNSKDELMDDLAAASTSAFTVTYTTNQPTASTTATVADGDAVTSAETGALFFNMQAQIDALIVDVGLIRTDLNA